MKEGRGGCKGGVCGEFGGTLGAGHRIFVGISLSSGGCFSMLASLWKRVFSEANVSV